MPTAADAMAAADVRRIGLDSELLEVLYREHVEAIQRFVARRVDDPHLAADLTSDIFLAALTSAHRYREDLGSPLGWLFGIARNVIANESRKRRAHLRAVGRIEGHRHLDDDSIARIEDRIVAERDARMILRTLATLPKRDQALIELVDLDGLPVSDAAATLGITPGAARVRLHRARAKLRAPSASTAVPEPAPTTTQEVHPS